MKITINIIAILASLYCIYYQIVFFIFNNLSRSSTRDYSNAFLSETLPQLLIIIICIIFLINNIEQLVKSLKSSK
jgi:hypothetical protein